MAARFGYGGCTVRSLFVCPEIPEDWTEDEHEHQRAHHEERAPKAWWNERRIDVRSPHWAILPARTRATFGRAASVHGAIR